jgi:hypothetical protein
VAALWLAARGLIQFQGDSPRKVGAQIPRVAGDRTGGDMAGWQVDPDVRSAATLDAAFYRSEVAFAQSLERIFARTWQWLGPLADVARPGRAMPPAPCAA